MAGPLANKVRAKYPGVYDDLDDASLEKAILEKYPDYADLAKPDIPETNSISAQQSESESPEFLSSLFQPLTDIPSRIASTVAEPMMQYGEGGDNPLRRGALYGGAFLQSLGNVGSAMTSPVDLAMAAGTGGASLAAKTGLQGAARGLSLLGKTASAGMAGHGAYNIYEGEGLVNKGLGALETVGGLVGMRAPMHGNLAKVAKVTEDTPVPSKVPSIPESAVSEPISTPEISIPEIPKSGLSPANALKQALVKSEPLNEAQSKIYTIQRIERLKQMAEATGETKTEIFHNQKRALAGEYAKVEITPLSEHISPEDFDALQYEIRNSPDLLNFESINAREGLQKLYNGQVPQPSELKLIRKVFGNTVDDELIEMAGRRMRKKGFWDKVGAVDTASRALMASLDMSAFLRQGKNFITHKEAWQNLPMMFKSWGSEGFYKAAMDEIQTRPSFTRPTQNGKVIGKSVAERAGLSITNRLDDPEEMFISRVVQKFPGVKPSERAYSGFLNKLRADVFDSMVGRASKRIGVSAEELDAKTLKDIGDFINNATGRGNLGWFEDHPAIINNVLFAPRLMAGKLRTMGTQAQAMIPEFAGNKFNQVFKTDKYATLAPEVRKESLRALLGNVGTGLMIGELMKMGGAKISNDPTSADFRKIKVGNTRLDPFAGDQQYGILAAKFLTGESTSTISGKTTDIWENKYGKETGAGLLGNFLRNRLAPVPSFAVSLLMQSEPGGRPFHVVNALLSRVVPLIVQDIYELAQDDPTLLPMAVPAFFGAGVQTYGRAQ